MAGSRGSAGRQRRLQESRQAQRSQWIVAGTVAVLAIALIVVAAGLIWAVYLPPREHVLSVGSRDFNAAAVADRARYLVAAGSSAAFQDPANEGITSLKREAILLEFGAPLVAEVTEQDVRHAIARRLGLLPPESTPTPEPAAEATASAAGGGAAEGTGTAGPAASTPEAAGATATGTTAAAQATTPGEATAEPSDEATPTATQAVLDDQVFATSYQAFLQNTPIGRGDFERLIRAGIIEERLEEQFAAELPESGPQLLVKVARTGGRAQGQALVDAVAAGEEFAQAAADAGVVTSPDEVMEVGWFAPETLPERLREAIAPLPAGETTEVLDDASAIGFEVYYVEARTEDEPYRAEVLEQLAAQQLDEFIQAQEQAEDIVRVDLSNDERGWINRRVQRAVLDG